MNSRASWYNPDAPGKVFGIGLTKTGTMSLAKALDILGYRTKHYPWSLEEIDQHDASCDIPVACRYKELDIMYPNSKFILTHRPVAEWLNTTSLKPPDEHKPPLWKIEARLRVYRSIHWDRQKWHDGYIRHYEDVMSYFGPNSERLLLLPVDLEDKWTPLCKFLNKPIPTVVYPWVNRTIKALRMMP